MATRQTTITVTCPTCGAFPGQPCAKAPQRKVRQAGGAPLRVAHSTRLHGDRRGCACETPMQKPDARSCSYCGLSTEGM